MTKKFKTAILISGNIGSGKTETAKILSELLGLPVINFADSLKEFLNDDFDKTYLWYDRGYKDKNRHKLVEMANHFKSVFGDDFFAREVCRRLEELGNESVVCGDLRFDEEFLYMYENFEEIKVFKIFKHESDLNKPDYPLKSTLLSVCDFHLIHNNGTLKDLKEKFK